MLVDDLERAGVAEVFVKPAGAVQVGHQQGHGGDADELAGREHLAGEEVAEGGRGQRPGGRQGVVARRLALDAGRAVRGRRGSTGRAPGRRPRASTAGPRRGPWTRSTSTRRVGDRRADLEPDRPGELRAAELVIAFGQGQLQLEPLARRHADLGQDVRRVRRAAGAVKAGVGLRGPRGGRGRSARPSWRSRASKSSWQASQWPCSRIARKRVGDLAGEPAGGAKDVPEQDEQPFPGGVEAGRQRRLGVEPPAPGEGERAEPGELLGGAARQKVAQPLDGGRVDPRARRGRRAGGRAARATGPDSSADRLERVDRRRRPELARRGSRRSARRPARAPRGTGRRRPAG